MEAAIWRSNRLCSPVPCTTSNPTCLSIAFVEPKREKTEPRSRSDPAMNAPHADEWPQNEQSRLLPFWNPRAPVAGRRTGDKADQLAQTMKFGGAQHRHRTVAVVPSDTTSPYRSSHCRCASSSGGVRDRHRRDQRTGDRAMIGHRSARSWDWSPKCVFGLSSVIPETKVEWRAPSLMRARSGTAATRSWRGGTARAARGDDVGGSADQRAATRFDRVGSSSMPPPAAQRLP